MDLISRAQRMFPTASPDDINRGITHFKSIDPEMTDDDILTNAQKVIAEKQAPIAAVPVSPVDSSKVDMVKQNLRIKYGMDDASAANRQAIVDQNTEDASGINWRAGLATLGAGLMGQNAIAAGESVLSRQAAERQGKLTEFDKARSNKIADFNQEREISKAEREDLQFSQDQDKLKREQDPNSEESKMAQDLAKAMGMGNVTGLTAAKFKEFSPALQKKYEIEQNKLNRQEARSDRQFQRDLMRDSKISERDDKDIQKLSKDVAGIQDMTTAINEVEKELGGSLDEFSTEGGLKKNGKEVDLPGVSLPWIGRVSAYDDKAQRLQSSAAKVFNTVLKDRSGAAVSNTELERLKTEFGQGKYNTEAQMIGALQRYKRGVNIELKNREAGYRPEVVQRYGEQGGTTSKNQPQTPPAGGSVKIQAPDGKIRNIPEKDVDAAIKAGGKRV